MIRAVLVVILVALLISSSGVLPELDISPPVAAFIEANIEAVEAAQERGTW